MKLEGLSRQIARSMMAIAFSVSLLVLLTSYAFYFLWKTYWPENFSDESLVPTVPELLWMIGTTMAGLALAVVVAINLSKRILVPLNSVADSIRRVAQGDLAARADAGDRSLGEAALLADDFNLLAEKLQRMTQEQTFWNAAIAHELRTPVTILRGRLQGLAEGVFEPEEALFQTLLTQVDGLTRLIEDLRVVGLAESGHLDLHIREANLDEEIRDVVAFCDAALRSAGQRAVLDLQAGPVRCDPMRIRQALLALIENVRRHAVAGDVIIRTHIDGTNVLLRVEDEGPGIPEEFASQVFTAFRRNPAAQAETDHKGTGLGLAVVAAIAHAHRGQASCRPTARGGSLFELAWAGAIGEPGANAAGQAAD
ncbi:ATP-binding protein [Paracidovorax anthurii]|uniref:histidine kinase n=1 Tax=Paracidovorax anthurii TaxID=78229 RepID=A0A328ZKL1_9BURK|nr:ATP-binding protein [Paracidovorax anthurii]RAR85683.1 two-component system sensor histidine kinase AdeS [Paracidovorax anthurii]